MLPCYRKKEFWFLCFLKNSHIPIIVFCYPDSHATWKRSSTFTTQEQGDTLHFFKPKLIITTNQQTFHSLVLTHTPLLSLSHSLNLLHFSVSFPSNNSLERESISFLLITSQQAPCFFVFLPLLVALYWILGQFSIFLFSRAWSSFFFLGFVVIGLPWIWLDLPALSPARSKWLSKFRFLGCDSAAERVWNGGSVLAAKRGEDR